MDYPRLPTVFHLMRNDQLLAVLDSCGPGNEMFWATCRFKPTELFADVALLFHEASETEDTDIFELIYGRLREMDVILIDVTNDIRIKYFMLHIEGDRVHLSYAEPPYEGESADF